MLNDAFISVVQDKDDEERLVARARVKGDLETVFGETVGLGVRVTPEADYRFRVFVTRPQVEDVLARAVDGIDYTNFKNSVAEKDRHDAYLRCWTAMAHLQDSRYGVPKKEKPSGPRTKKVKASA